LAARAPQNPSAIQSGQRTDGKKVARPKPATCAVNLKGPIHRTLRHGHLWELRLHGIYVTGASEGEAIRNWKKAAQYQVATDTSAA
jgi:hypothetical protein